MRGWRKFGLLVAFAALALPAAASAAAGDLDPSFGSAGVRSLAAGTSLNGVAVQSDHQVVAVGSSGNSMLVERFSATGSPAGTFSAGSGVGRAVVVQGDGKIVVAGNDSAGFVIERFNSDGSLDGGFGSHGAVHAMPGGRANAVVLGPGGTIIAAGQVPGADGFQRVAIVRLTSTGSPDTSLGAGGAKVVDLGQDSVANGVAAQNDGKILIAGSIGPGTHQVTNAIAARLTSGGSLDSSFGSGGGYLLFPQAGGGEIAFNAITVDPAGAVVVAGGGTTMNQSIAVFARLTCSGAADGGFAGHGLQFGFSSRDFNSTADGANGVAVVSGRRVVGAGQFQDSGLTEASLWGFESNGTPDFAKQAPFGARSAALAVDSNGNLVVAGTNVPAGFLPSGFVARYAGFGGPASGSSQCGGGPINIVTTPSLSRVGQAHGKWTESRSRKNKKTPVGTKFNFTLDQAARVTFSFSQGAKGRKVRGKCVAQTNKNRKNRSCNRTVGRGSFSVNGKAGNNSVSFKGKIGRRNLAPGSYTVTITAKGSNGKTSKGQSLRFTIVR